MAEKEILQKKEETPVRETLNLAVRLMLFALVATLLLAAVNALTEDRIAENTREKVNAARRQVIGECEFEEAQTDLTGFDLIKGVYAATEDGNPAGYVYELESRGYGGTIYLCVGVRTDGTVSGVEVSGHSETKGLGTPAQKGFLAQFVDKKAESVPTMKADAMTGATISSTAIRKAVDQATSHFNQNFGGEDAQ